MADHLVQWVTLTGWGQAQPTGQGLPHKFRRFHRRKRHKEDAIRIGPQLLSRRLNRQPGLADATRTQQRQQTTGRVGQPLPNLVKLLVTSDEYRIRSW